MQPSPSWVETIKVQGNQVLEQVQKLIEEGNVQRITIKQDEHVVAVFPLTVGVVGVVFAPALAAIGLLIALLTNCTIVLERASVTTPTTDEATEEAAAAATPSDPTPDAPTADTTPDTPPAA